MKKVLVLVFVLASVLLLSACETTETPDKTDQDDLLSLTIEELATYNGEDGMDGYIAVDGVIYDVTDVAAWSSGSHNGGMMGTDVTELISSAPHGENVLDDLEVVGNIIE